MRKQKGTQVHKKIRHPATGVDMFIILSTTPNRLPSFLFHISYCTSGIYKALELYGNYKTF